VFVPVCCSASHIAMTSIRMEPVWMTLAEAAGVAASMAITGECAVQRVDYATLRAKLSTLGARVEPIQLHYVNILKKGLKSLRFKPVFRFASGLKKRVESPIPQGSVLSALRDIKTGLNFLIYAVLPSVMVALAKAK